MRQTLLRNQEKNPSVRNLIFTGTPVQPCFHKTPPVIPILTQSNPIYIFVSCFRKFRFNIILLLLTMTSKWPLTSVFSDKLARILLSLPPSCYTSRQSLFSVVLQPKSRPGHLTVQIYRSHTHTQTHARKQQKHTRQDSSGWGISSSHRPLPVKYSRHKRGTSMPSAGFEPAIPAIKRLQYYALNRTASVVGFIRPHTHSRIYITKPVILYIIWVEYKFQECELNIESLLQAAVGAAMCPVYGRCGNMVVKDEAAREFRSINLLVKTDVHFVQLPVPMYGCL